MVQIFAPALRPFRGLAHPEVQSLEITGTRQPADRTERGRRHRARLPCAGPMRRADFHYELPPELIAQTPLSERSASRLLCLDGLTGALVDRQFADLPALLQPHDLLVFNDTRVVAARLFGTKPSGGRVEIFLERGYCAEPGAGADARQQAHPPGPAPGHHWR